MTRTVSLIHNIIAIAAFMFFTIFMVPGCSSGPKRVSIPSNANASEVLNSLSEDMSIAKQNEIDVLSPRNYDKARDHYITAKKAYEKGTDNEDVFESVSLSKAYLNLANEHASRVRGSAADILSARSDAISAGAAQVLPKRLEKADNYLKEATFDAEKNKSSIKAESRADLQRNYLELQTEAIKVTQLAPAEKLIDMSKKNGARRHVPITLASAEAKLQQAKNIIETDRNNAAAIRVSSIEARREANKLYNVAEIAKKNRASEKVALELNARRMASAQMSEELVQVESQLAEKNSEVEGMQAENEKLERANQFNQSLAWAQEQFNPNEAEVYRQGDKLLIRLKNMNYKSGQKELSAAAYPLLDKVKEVIGRVGAESVKVEGHTDSIGSQILNQSLSQARAEGVANYLGQDNVVSKNQIEAEGLGYEKPLTSNKTSQGRALNRRVDVIITPSVSTAAAPSRTE